MTFIDSLRQRALLGLCQTYPAPGIIEGMGRGWDFVWIDGQHGQFSLDALLHCIRAAEGVGLHTLLRVPTHDPGWLGVYADLKPSALLVPLVNNPAEAESIARALTFPPSGSRSFGGRRPIDFHGRSYCERPGPSVVAQIETLEALDNADRIAAIDGIDGLFFGGDDMKLSMGLHVDTPVFKHERLLAAMKRMAQAATGARKCAGCVATDPDTVSQSVAMGYHLIIGGADSGFLRGGASQALQKLRPAIGNEGTQTPPPQAGASAYG